MITINIEDHITPGLVDLADHFEHLPMEEIAGVMVASVHENFEAEGRPDPWEPRKDDNPWPILNKTGALKNSIESMVSGNEITVYAGFYGQFHDEGTTWLPARPFLLLQDEDMAEIEEILDQHLGMYL